VTWSSDASKEISRQRTIIAASPLSTGIKDQVESTLSALAFTLDRESSILISEEVKRNISTGLKTLASHLREDTPPAMHRDQQILASVNRLRTQFAHALAAKQLLMADEMDGEIALAREVLAQARASSLEVAEILTRAQAQQATLASLVSREADKSLSSHYRDEASAERKLATRWRLFAAATFVMAVAIGVFTAFAASAENAEWQAIPGRAGVVVALLGLGGYLEGQQRMHRTREMHASEVALKLETLGPFSEELDDQSRWRLRELVGRDIFASHAKLEARKETRDDI
jgi:hypothetical protein